MMRRNKNAVSPRPRRRFRTSIQMKVLLAILLTAVIVIAAVWILLMVSMNDYYVRVKKDSFGDLLASVSASLDERGMAGSQDELAQLAGKNHVCIVVVRDDGIVMKVDALPYNCYVHKDEETLTEYVEAAQTQTGKLSIHSVSDVDVKTDYFIGTIRSESKWGGGYAAVVTQTLESARDAVAAVENQLLFISALLILLAIILALIVSRSMTKPILQVTNAARRIAGGDLSASVNVCTRDEIGDLADNFNLMSRELSRVNVLQRELVANISHDMRTPLTMIRGYAETIRDITGEDPAERNKELDIIIDESNRLSTLVSDVLDLSLMQAGQAKLNYTVFDMTRKAGDILGRFRLLEQTSGFEFVLESDAPRFVLADEVRIEQVLYNLINNAVNHIGEIKRITVRVYPLETGIRVEVSDTGTGIPQEDLPLIWDRYYKPYKKTGREMGTGLGLSIVKAVLVNHQSQFGVLSTLGQGSTFWFMLRPGQPPEDSSTE